MSTAQHPELSTLDERAEWFEYLDAMEDVPFGWTLGAWLRHMRDCGTCEDCTK